MGTSDCFLPPSCLVPFLVFRSLSSSFLALVHEHMAKNKLAAKVYDYAEVEGAPNVVEYLDLSIWQTLYQLFKPEKEPGVDPFQLRVYL